MTKIFVVCGVFILFDIITGIVKGCYKGVLNSTKLREGLYHKLSEIIAICGSALIEYGLSYVTINVDVPILSAVSAYICITELISILENLCEVNPMLSKLFKPYLEKLKDKQDGDKND